MIRIEGLHKSFGKHDVLKGLDFELAEGSTTAILGPNGSGKTTLIKAILGMVIPTKGGIQVNNTAVKNDWRYREEIGYMPQIANFPANLRVKELIKMIDDLRNEKARSEPLIELFDLKEMMGKRLGELSGGTRQKVNAVIALMFDSPIVILDEPTTGLDPVALIKLKDLLKEYKRAGRTIFITTHIMSFVEEMADNVVFLLEGKVYFHGPLKELLAQQGEEQLDRTIARIMSNEHA